jgi:hypothetical protein
MVGILKSVLEGFQYRHSGARASVNLRCIMRMGGCAARIGE